MNFNLQSKDLDPYFATNFDPLVSLLKVFNVLTDAELSLQEALRSARMSKQAGGAAESSPEETEEETARINKLRPQVWIAPY